jgi:hypothetical protein
MVHIEARSKYPSDNISFLYHSSNLCGDSTYFTVNMFMYGFSEEERTKERKKQKSSYSSLVSFNK